jgi:uncharacterized membrane protein YsdA (DUF1294 family)
MSVHTVRRALAGLPSHDRALATVQRWRAFTRTSLGARLLPLYAILLGGGAGVLVADRLVRSMWRHAIFNGADQWRTVAIGLTLFWIAIGAVAALALLGPPAGEEQTDAPVGPRSTEEPAA